MSYTIAEIAASLGVAFEGDGELRITAVAEPAMAGPDDLAMAMKPEYAAGLPDGAARAAMLWQGADWQSFGLQAALLATRPRFVMSGLSAMMDPGPGYGPGIHPSAVIDPTAQIGQDVSIGAMTVVDAGAHIGDGSVIGPQCHIGWNATLGTGALLHSGVKICARVTIGDHLIAHPGVVIGSDGFSFVTPETSGVEKARATLGGEGNDQAQSWARIHSLGSVTIENNVEIGANSCIDRGTVRDTVLHSGCKLDNLVHVGHNVVVGEDTLLCGQVGIAGSSVIGSNCVLGGQVGISDNILIGDRAIIGGGSGVLTNVPAGRVMLGYPAIKMENHVESYKGFRRLPRLFRDVADLKKAVSKLTGND
ncbi:UDP-3-O-(3-hydroxymyristoyl)glucosamine N-acyltransferase [uncultured Pelagimonas sp.]|uniref:UDP-3-O-(3-hydroxymyristoyl)glucosamine N-acyltransferase n=1 Tax=uncultured Pelagimonas sp. TaxID=1618102 RepID=UPI002621C94E|nr:UDP-3-O-(3-hydroxymyristoyl)glucosamine N-acyltransferase [uncultured Pelagimonas sp.]